MEAEKTATQKWQQLRERMRVVQLTFPLQVLVPALGLPSLAKSTRGFTLYPGRTGSALGILLMAASGVVGFLLYGPAGPVGPALAAWLIGTAGVAMFVSSLRPTAFVKPICTRCRLLPVIKEHEAIHLSGVASEKAVWTAIKGRHSIASLSLEGDPSICTFCPIPKRLSEQ